MPFSAIFLDVIGDTWNLIVLGLLMLAPSGRENQAHSPLTDFGFQTKLARPEGLLVVVNSIETPVEGINLEG